MAFINRKYKDSVFTDLFGSDIKAKKNFLEHIRVCILDGLTLSLTVYGKRLTSTTASGT